MWFNSVTLSESGQGRSSDRNKVNHDESKLSLERTPSITDTASEKNSEKEKKISNEKEKKISNEEEKKVSNEDINDKRKENFLESSSETINIVDLSYINGNYDDANYYDLLSAQSSSDAIELNDSDSRISEEMKNTEKLSLVDVSLEQSVLVHNTKLFNYLDERYIDPIEHYILKTNRSGGNLEDGKKYNLEEFRFILYLWNKVDIDLIQDTPRLKQLPNIKELSIQSANSENKYINDFLLNVAPQQLEKFVFRGDNKRDKDRL